MIGVIFMETSPNISSHLHGPSLSNSTLYSLPRCYFLSSIHRSLINLKGLLWAVILPQCLFSNTQHFEPNTFDIDATSWQFFPENQFFTNYVVRSKNWLELRLNKCLKLFSPSCECLERMQTVRPHCNVPCSPPIVCSGFILLTINCLPDFSEYFYSLLFVSNETLTRL